MNRPLRTAALALPFLVAIAGACSDDDTASTGSTFAIALTVAGQGHVTTAPTGLDCEGPRDCGSHDFASGAVTLTTTAATGFKLSKIDVNGVTSTDGVVRGTAGATQTVTVTFVATGTVDTGNLDADAGADAGGCTTADACGVSAVCCIRARSTAAGFVPTGSSCESPDACRRNDDQGQAGYPVCNPPTDTRCTPGEACVATAEGSATSVCVLPSL